MSATVLAVAVAAGGLGVRAASASPYRSAPAIAASVAGYLVVYTETLPGDCLNGESATPGACATHTQSLGVRLDIKGNLLDARPISIGSAASDRDSQATVLAAGARGWLVHAGLDHYMVTAAGEVTSASHSLSVLDWKEPVSVSDGWLIADLGDDRAPRLTHVSYDGAVSIPTRVAAPIKDSASVVKVGAGPAGDLLVAWAEEARFAAVRLDASGKPVDSQVIVLDDSETDIGPASRSTLRISSTPSGWLVYTARNQGESLVFVDTTGAVTARRLPIHDMIGDTVRFAYPTATGALWFELDDVALLTGATEVPLRVTTLAADGAPEGASRIVATTAGFVATAAGPSSFAFVERGDASVHVLSLASDGAATTEANVVDGGCSTARAHGGSPISTVCCGAMLLMVALRRRERR